MRNVKAKRLRRKANEIVVEWLRNLMPSEEAVKITPSNIEQFLPEQRHVFGKGMWRVSSLTPRWVYLKLKKDPSLTAADIINNAN